MSINRVRSLLYCRDAMGIAIPVGVHRPAQRPPRYLRRRTRRPTVSPGVTALLGSFSNQHGQHPLRVEIVDAKRRGHQAFARPAGGRRDRGQVRRRPTAVSPAPQRPAIPIATLQERSF